MPNLKINAEQTARLIGARSLVDSERKSVKAAVFADIRASMGVPKAMKMKVEIDDKASADYRVLKAKSSGLALYGEGDRYVGVVAPTPVAVPVPARSAVGFLDSDDLYDLLHGHDSEILSDDAPEVSLPDGVNVMVDADNGGIYFRR
jgi:hypothetical protein